MELCTAVPVNVAPVIVMESSSSGYHGLNRASNNGCREKNNPSNNIDFQFGFQSPVCSTFCATNPNDGNYKGNSPQFSTLYKGIACLENGPPELCKTGWAVIMELIKRQNRCYCRDEICLIHFVRKLTDIWSQSSMFYGNHKTIAPDLS